MKRIDPPQGYAKLIDEHADLFAELFSALLGEQVTFAGRTEKWIVWPAAGTGSDPREEELGAKGSFEIRPPSQRPRMPKRRRIVGNLDPATQESITPRSTSPTISPWCTREDLNLYTFRYRNLNPARLPIPPLVRGRGA